MCLGSMPYALALSVPKFSHPALLCHPDFCDSLVTEIAYTYKMRIMYLLWVALASWLP